MILLSVLLMLHDMSYMKYHFTPVISSFNTLIWQRLWESLEMNVFILFLINMIEDDYVYSEPLCSFLTPVPRNKNFFSKWHKLISNNSNKINLGLSNRLDNDKN